MIRVFRTRSFVVLFDTLPVVAGVHRLKIACDWTLTPQKSLLTGSAGHAKMGYASQTARVIRARNSPSRARALGAALGRTRGRSFIELGAVQTTAEVRPNVLCWLEAKITSFGNRRGCGRQIVPVVCMILCARERLRMARNARQAWDESQKLGT